MNLFIYLFFFLSSSLAILDLPFKLFKGVAKCYIASFLPSLAEIISAFEAIAQAVFYKSDNEKPVHYDLRAIVDDPNLSAIYISNGFVHYFEHF